MNRRLTTLVVLLMVLEVLVPAPTVEGQTAAKATLTVIRGVVNVVRMDGTAIAPALTGLDLMVGDEVSTMDQSQALITFFDGTEIELTPSATLILRDVTIVANQTSITIESVIGTTTHRVQSVLDPGSSYRVISGGSVAVVRGTEFTVNTLPNGDVNVDLKECGQHPGEPPRTYCLEFPVPGRFMQVGENCTMAQRNGVGTLTCTVPVRRTVRTVRTTRTTRNSR